MNSLLAMEPEQALNLKVSPPDFGEAVLCCRTVGCPVSTEDSGFMVAPSLKVEP